MKLRNNDDWIPERRSNVNDEERRVGVELEFTGCKPEHILQCITNTYGGDIHDISVFKYEVKDTDVGDFILELDAQLLHKLAEKNNAERADGTLIKLAEDVIKSAAEQWVPWEVVAPPIKVSNLQQLNKVFSCLRDKGALGTRHAARFAFGLHLNPELPDLKPQTLVQYMQAYLCLYDWIYDQEKIDVVRKITPYIDHFDKEYILKVVDADYSPDLDRFIKDYLEYNPTRNRSLDFLPLFAHIDEKWVDDLNDKALIKPRPTFHYRLPNCDIDNSEWNLDTPWSLWLKVEALANDPDLLRTFIDEFRQDYKRVTRSIDKKWLKRCSELLKKLNSDERDNEPK